MNFVIYDDIGNKKVYESAIYNFVGKREEKFKIYNFEDYKSSSCISNIYIISSLNIKKALGIVNKIRDSKDWKSQIIVISNIKSVEQQLLLNRLLILDYIDINNLTNNKLKEGLYIAYKILNENKCLNIIYDSEISKIPYDDILYIEKNNNQNYCTIHTIKSNYKIKDTITNLEQTLDSVCFMKTHRSCIVNLYNVKNYCYPKNIIFFSNGENIDLISRDKRQILKSKLIEENIQI